MLMGWDQIQDQLEYLDNNKLLEYLLDLFEA